jgi:5-methylthioribose kinase
MPVFELSAQNAAEYLQCRGIVADTITELGGGVSNTVLLVKSSNSQLVLKQALPQLRVQDEWLADRSRIIREANALEDCAHLLPPGSVPKVLWLDEPNYLLAMSAVEGAPWKTQLFAGEMRPEIARQVGRLLADLISKTWHVQQIREKYADQTAFDQLRIDPYYRTIARRHPDLAKHVSRLIADSSARRVSLVHGDFSPKNLIVNGSRVALIDFEVVHYGDPAFDAGFCLNHLALKAIVLPQWRVQLEAAAKAFWSELTGGLSDDTSWFEPATLQHLGCLMLARVDGKSPVEYLSDDRQRAWVRALARDLIINPPNSIDDLWPRFA